MSAANTDLSDAEYAALLGFRTGLRRFLSWSAERAKAAGLTPAQHQLLLVCRGLGDDQGPTIGQVAEQLLLRHHSAVELIDRAVAAGLVVRASDADDQRVVRVKLTPEGRAKLAALSAQHRAELDRLRPQLREIWQDLDDEGRAVPGGPAR